ncbi:MAG: type I asparaginase [Bacteroidetes bacterium]|nr:MAG: type I asparaginase [Bacteroidota bacterium]
MSRKTKILLVYTGGTIGMIQNPKTGELTPFDFEHLLSLVPEISRLPTDIQTISFQKPLDSSDIQPAHWVQMAEIIENHYDRFDGFVILHGTDTLSYSASALSFMLEGLNKPVIFTGSQLPIGVVRTDGKENLITAIEIASDYRKGKPVVPEVAVYFEYKLMRGNRTYKYSADYFDAFRSENYPILAEAGISIDYNFQFIASWHPSKLSVHKQLCDEVAILKVFPGIKKEWVESYLRLPALKGLVLETFGSGNATTQPWFIETLRKLIDKGVVVVNVTQCKKGSVHQGKYATSAAFEKIGVLSGFDITFESALTKLMFLLGNPQLSDQERRQLFVKPIRGEMTVSESQF